MADLRWILTEAAERAFEDLGFLMPDLASGEGAPARAGGEASAEPRRGMMVRFRGPVDGALVVWGDAALLEALAGNMVGTERTPPLALQLDALGEMANVICGNVLPVAGDRAAVFRLDTPVPAPPTLPGPEERVRGEVRIHLDAGVVDILLLERVS